MSAATPTKEARVKSLPWSMRRCNSTDMACGRRYGGKGAGHE